MGKPSEKWMRKMAEAEDQCGSVAVGPLEDPHDEHRAYEIAKDFVGVTGMTLGLREQRLIARSYVDLYERMQKITKLAIEMSSGVGHLAAQVAEAKVKFSDE